MDKSEMVEIRGAIRSFLVDNFLFGQADRLKDDEPLLDSVVESSGVLELVSFLEEHFDIIMKDKDINPANLGSVDKIVGCVTRKLQEKS
jgi:acyl carrier protein